MIILALYEKQNLKSFLFLFHSKSFFIIILLLKFFKSNVYVLSKITRFINLLYLFNY